MSSHKKTDNIQGFLIGNVKLEPVLRSMHEIKADVLVQSASVGDDPNYTYLAKWAKAADLDGLVSSTLSRHKPFKLGDVIIVPAGQLQAKYLFSAIVIDRAEGRRSGNALNDKIVADTAKKCITIAAALGLESIAFTPWGTRAAGAEAAHITAVMLNSIIQAIKASPGVLRVVYLVSNDAEHYKWFVDRSFILNMFVNQIEEVKHTVRELQISKDQQQHIEQMLNNITNNITVYNQSVHGDNIQTGDITDSNNIAFGDGASVQSSMLNTEIE